MLLFVHTDSDGGLTFLAGMRRSACRTVSWMQARHPSGLTGSMYDDLAPAAAAAVVAGVEADALDGTPGVLLTTAPPPPFNLPPLSLSFSLSFSSSPP